MRGSGSSVSSRNARCFPRHRPPCPGTWSRYSRKSRRRSSQIEPQKEVSAPRSDPAAPARSPGANFRSARPASRAIREKRPPSRWEEKPPAAQRWMSSPENGLRPPLVTGLLNEDYPPLLTFYESCRSKFLEIFGSRDFGTTLPATRARPCFCQGGMIAQPCDYIPASARGLFFERISCGFVSPCL